MLTFEKVLEVFKEYLAEDTNCEVVITKPKIKDKKGTV